MFKLTELVLWLGLSEFEIFIHLLGTLIFTILLAIRIATTSVAIPHVPPTIFGQTLDWYGVFAPLFAADVMNGYFAIIVGIRMYIAHDNKRKGLHRLLWSTKCLVLVGVFKYLLCLKLAGTQNLDYSEVFAPVFVLLQLVAVRACKLSGN